MNSKVTYKLQCNICNDVCIGETKRHFLVCEYLGKSVLTEKNLKYSKKNATAAWRHCRNHFHTADISCFSLIGNAANKYHLKSKDFFFILKLKTSLNVAKESMLLYLLQNGSQFGLKI